MEMAVCQCAECMSWIVFHDVADNLEEELEVTCPPISTIDVLSKRDSSKSERLSFITVMRSVATFTLGASPGNP